MSTLPSTTSGVTRYLSRFSRNNTYNFRSASAWAQSPKVPVRLLETRIYMIPARAAAGRLRLMQRLPRDCPSTFSGTSRSLATPTVGCPMMRCLPCAQKLGCLRLGRSHRRISTPLTYISLLPPPHLCLWLWCQCSVGVADSRFQ